MKNYVGCFLTGTAAEVTPVSQIDKYNFKVCDLITELNISYQALVRKKSAAQLFLPMIKTDQANNLINFILNNN